MSDWIEYVETEAEPSSEVDSENRSSESNSVNVTNVNQPLAECLGLPVSEYDENFLWVPPKTSGLNNCEYIVPLITK